MKKDLKAFGFKVESDEKDFELEVLEENIEAIQVFNNMLTQVVVAGMGSVVGFNYQSLDWVMTLLEVKDKKECFLKFRLIERHFLKIMWSRDGSAT